MRGRKESKICDFGWLLNEPQYGVLPHLLGFLGLVEVTTSLCLVCKPFRVACDTSLAGRRVSDMQVVKEILEGRPCPQLLSRLVRPLRLLRRTCPKFPISLGVREWP